MRSIVFVVCVLAGCSSESLVASEQPKGVGDAGSVGAYEGHPLVGTWCANETLPGRCLCLMFGDDGSFGLRSGCGSADGSVVGTGVYAATENAFVATFETYCQHGEPYEKAPVQGVYVLVNDVLSFELSSDITIAGAAFERAEDVEIGDCE